MMAVMARWTPQLKLHYVNRLASNLPSPSAIRLALGLTVVPSFIKRMFNQLNWPDMAEAERRWLA